MAYKEKSPIPVVEGGTGAQTFTAHGVLLGEGTSAVGVTGAATDGQVLVGKTSNDPSFITPAAGTGLAITTNSTTLSYALSTPVSIANGGTNATSMATTDGVVYYDGTRLVTTSAGTSGQVLTSNGAGVAPTYQAAAGGFTTQFVAYKDADTTNATGDGTFVTLACNQTASNNGSNYNTGTFTYTAPSTGLYYFSWQVTFTNLASGHTSGVTELVTTAQTYYFNYVNPFATQNAGSSAVTLGSSFLVPMTASDTALISVAVSSSTKTVTIAGSSTVRRTLFCGFRVA
jgi:hypothetical protein